MIFKDRQEAGQELAAHLGRYASRDDVLVLGVPRGGVPVAFEVATALKRSARHLCVAQVGISRPEGIGIRSHRKRWGPGSERGTCEDARNN